MRNAIITAAILLQVLSYDSRSGRAVSAQDSQQIDTAASDRADGTQLWFVELASPPTSDGTPLAALENEEQQFHEAAAAAAIGYSEQRHFRRLWNGLSVRAGSGEASKLAALPGVGAVYPVLTVEPDQDPAGDVPELLTTLVQTGADVAQRELGLTGAGVRVALIDTGIDYDHPDLGGCFGPGCRVEMGWDFVGDAFNPSSPSSTRMPDPFPDDCAGHGTHVAGIVGANGTIRGVAPGVTFHAYRVLGCVGPTTADIILEAMERALADGADVVNISIGAAFQWPMYPTAQGADRLVQEGLVVVASIGNNGANGLYSASAPGVGRRVIGVASFDNTHRNFVAIAVTPDGRLAAYNPAEGAPLPPTSGSFPMRRTGTRTSTADACNGATAPAAGSLTGAVALIRRGSCGFFQQASNAQRAGAAGIIFYNSGPGRSSVVLTGSPPITIPVGLITAVDGQEIDSRIAAGPVTMTWTDKVVSEPAPTANRISSFSSFGPAPDLSLKPDIGAPGGQVRSTLPLEQGGAGPNSGTSMAAPHVTGAVALLLQAHPGLTPRVVRDVLQNSAEPRLWSGDPSLGLLEMVHRQGAGMLNIPNAIRAAVRVTPGRLSLGEIVSGAVTRRLTVRVLADDSADDDDQGEDPPTSVGTTYTLGHAPALATGPNTFRPTTLSAFATVGFSVSTVTVGPESRHAVSFDVTIAPPAAGDARVFGGYITLTPNDGGTELRVPYTGYHGDYQAIPSLVPTVNGFPWLARLDGSSFINLSAGGSFTLVGADVPYVLVHLDHPVERLLVEVVDVATGRARGFAVKELFVGRNSGASSFYSLPWDGTFVGSERTVSNGTYRFELSVLKALGDQHQPGNWERWRSSNFVIARPVPTTP